MKRILPKNTVLIITPTNITYTIDNNEINKTYLLTKNKLRKNMSLIKFNEFYNLVRGKSSKNEELEKNYIPPTSFVYFNLFAQKAKIPSPEMVTNKYLEVFCEKINENEDKYKIKEKFIIDKQIEFTYNEIAAYICRRYNSYNRKIILMSGLYDINKNLDMDIEYEYNNEIYNNIDIKITIEKNLYFITTSKEDNFMKYNEKLINALKKQYDNIHIITINEVKDSEFETIENMQFYNDVFDKNIFNKIEMLYMQDSINNNLEDVEIPDESSSFIDEPIIIPDIEIDEDIESDIPTIVEEKKPEIKKEVTSNFMDTYLDYDKEPFFITGLKTEFF